MGPSQVPFLIILVVFVVVRSLEATEVPLIVRIVIVGFLLVIIELVPINVIF